jgi:site-specific DNA-methyltransferase (adenine-specific)
MTLYAISPALEIIVRPYYQDEYVTIYNGDCRDFIDNLAPFHLVCTDPPYANGTGYDVYLDTEENLRSLVSEVIVKLVGLSSRMAISPGVGNIMAYPRPAWTLAWVSTAGCGSGPWGFCCWQPILVYGKCPYLEAGLGRMADIILSNERSVDYGHPCPKPLNLWKSVIKRVSANSLCPIFDPFMGSGTTLRAAKDAGRKAIGIDISEKYCEIAAERMSQCVLDLGAQNTIEAGETAYNSRSTQPEQLSLDGVL